MGALAYTLFAGAFIFFANTCSSFACSGIVLLLMLPWILFVDEAGFSISLAGINLNVSEATFFWSTVVLNIIVSYLLFAALERWLKKGK